MKSPNSSSRSSYWGRRFGPRAALIAGFAALLALLVALSLDSVRALRELEAASAQIRRENLSSERALQQIRASTYDSGNLLREYTLGDSRPETRESYRAQLNDMREHAAHAMQDSVRGAAPNLQDHFTKLAAQLERYWTAADHTLSDDADEENKAQKHREALAQRAAVLAIATEISNINELELRAAELEIARAHARSRSRLHNVSVLAIVTGLFLATTSILYLSRLENRAEQKYLETLRYQNELKDLSKRVVEAQEQERQAISRDLHDQVGQSLAALLMDVQNLAESDAITGSLRNALQRIKALGEESAKVVRNMALLLRPSMLDDLGLIAALEWQGREVSRRTGLIVDVVADEFADNLSDEHKTCIYRIAQEALHNSAKHARAKRVRVLVRENSNHVILLIEDDGVGFDPSRHGGLGVLGMHERATRLDGVLTIDSSPGQGTRLLVDFPLSPAQQTRGALS